MRKVILVLLCNLLVFCLALVFAEKTFSIKVDDYLDGQEEQDGQIIVESVAEEDYYLLYAEDGAEYSQINIDVKDKSYVNGKISVLDTEFRLSSELEEEVMRVINGFGGSSAFYMISLKDGASIGYNVDKAFETASSIKAPYAYYVYKLIEDGKIKGTDKIEYLPKHYNGGTGSVKNNPFGTKFTVEDLVHRSIVESDNIAHIMLHDTYGVSGYNEMLKSIGTEQLYLTKYNPWAFTSPRSAALVWLDIYNFSLSSPYGIKLFNEFSSVNFNYYNEVLPSVSVASKAGWASKSVVETGIVFDEIPYVAIAMVARNGNYSSDVQLLSLIEMMDKIMTEYEGYIKSNS